MTTTEYRLEHDLLGEKTVLAEAYWGIHTARAIENFAISRYQVPQTLIQALAMVKKACCIVNAELGYLDYERAATIGEACHELIEGKLRVINHAGQGQSGNP
ncbi:MAG: hypothetical protein GY801_15950 [bacterium]|nr:hypothetical protein [bacterium]